MDILRDCSSFLGRFRDISGASSERFRLCVFHWIGCVGRVYAVVVHNRRASAMGVRQVGFRLFFCDFQQKMLKLPLFSCILMRNEGENRSEISSRNKEAEQQVSSAFAPFRSFSSAFRSCFAPFSCFSLLIPSVFAYGWNRCRRSRSRSRNRRRGGCG